LKAFFTTNEVCALRGLGFFLFGGKRGKSKEGSRSKEFVLGFCGGGGLWG